MSYTFSKTDQGKYKLIRKKKGEEKKAPSKDEMIMEAMKKKSKKETGHEC
jgi:hypothetical protein